MMRLALMAALGAAAILAVPAQAGARLIHAGTLLAKPGEAPLKEQTIVVENGRIKEIRAGYSEPDSDESVVDLKAYFVLPGLIDSHVHLLGELGPKQKVERVEDSPAALALRGAYNARRTLAAGFTTVRDVGAPGGSGDAIFALRDAIAKGWVWGPRVYASGSTISPTGGHAQTYGYRDDILELFASDGVCDGAVRCREAVRRQVGRGANHIKLVATGGVLSDIAAGTGQQFFDDEMRAIVEAAHRLGRRATAHAHGADGIKAALRAGVDSIEHGTFMDDEAIALFKTRGAYYVPTVLAGMTVAEYAKTSDFMSPAVKAKSLAVGPQILETLRRAHKAGVKIAFGTDTGVSRHGDNAREFVLMVEAGMTPMETIRAATVAAADHLGVATDIGTIEPGKIADIVAVAENPLDNVSALTRMRFVMKDGAVFKRD